MMKELNQFELDNVSGGIAPLVALGAGAAILTVADGVWSFGKGVVQGWND
ncbi:class IIb bacteriocin, lactobin A/cerein 7B family [Neisseria chenwenguii]|uniref:Uncharacterized protein n=1 Tax=Neisseria chenwenguii TaxID=1853278 RepID=A0A220RZX2_9NEIS|nr:class IIb bacteriocin, lactobin A/cerein 7B family [Neisseria chenwenguii]ASK26779.1 hypothetical protein BG910_02615 [Neisseria chenwenguii]ROV52477.1 class IIb bacteriocin, lactobin A/cerein 7B family [Neisseria chenwenguii]